MKNLLVCELCRRKYSESDVENLNYFPEQGVCFFCYLDGSKKTHREWCFGKLNIKDEKTGTIRMYGYDPELSFDCRKYCQDRKICHLFVTKKIFQFRMLLKSKLPFKSGTPSARAFVACIMGTTVSKLTELVKYYGGDVAMVFRKLRRQKFGDYRWKYRETDDEKIKIRM